MHQHSTTGSLNIDASEFDGMGDIEAMHHIASRLYQDLKANRYPDAQSRKSEIYSMANAMYCSEHFTHEDQPDIAAIYDRAAQYHAKELGLDIFVRSMEPPETPS